MGKNRETVYRCEFYLMNYQKLQLTVTKGPDTGLTVDTAGASVRIGTSPENDSPDDLDRSC